ncbi:MAG TPA: hypothetical protein DCR55_02725 [Lentisphaeria bacterium]|nr:hypothetical protein [Lentisphaeria bacterium]
MADDNESNRTIDATIVTERDDDSSAARENVVKHASLFVVGSDRSVTEHPLQSDACLVAIGTDAKESDILIADDDCAKKQLVVMNIGSHWMFLDCGPKDVVWLDGVCRRQLYAPIDYRGVARIGKQHLVFAGTGEVPTGTQEASSKDVILKTEEPGDDARLHVRGLGGHVSTNKWPLLIGSHETCDLTDESLAPFHAFLFWGESGPFIEPIAGAALEIGGNAVTEAHPIDGDARANLGTAGLSISVEGDAQKHAEELYRQGVTYDSFALTALNDSIDDSFFLPGFGRPVTIGRGETCDIVLNDMAVSREHAQIVPAGKTLNLIDNFSANGTYVNGIKVPKARVRAGDVIEIGDNFFLVHYTS